MLNQWLHSLLHSLVFSCISSWIFFEMETRRQNPIPLDFMTSTCYFFMLTSSQELVRKMLDNLFLYYLFFYQKRDGDNNRGHEEHNERDTDNWTREGPLTAVKDTDRTSSTDRLTREKETLLVIIKQTMTWFLICFHFLSFFSTSCLSSELTLITCYSILVENIFSTDQDVVTRFDYNDLIITSGRASRRCCCISIDFLKNLVNNNWK